MRNLDQDLFEQVQAQMEQPTFLQRVSERMWKCEGLFAESKQNHCLARAKYRGRPKVQIQAYLCDRAEPQATALPTLLLAGRCLPSFHAPSARRQSANSTPPNSTHQMTAESILFQHAPSFAGVFPLAMRALAVIPGKRMTSRHAAAVPPKRSTFSSLSEVPWLGRVAAQAVRSAHRINVR